MESLYGKTKPPANGEQYGEISKRMAQKNCKAGKDLPIEKLND